MSSGGAVDILSMLSKAQSECNQQNSVATFFQACSRDKSQKQFQNIDSLESIERQLRSDKAVQEQEIVNSPLAQFINSNNLQKNITNNKLSSVPQQVPVKEKKTNGAQPQSALKAEKILITPTMLKSSNNNNERKETKKSEDPLTKNQLLQTMNYLMENDEEFNAKVYDAYVKSFSRSTSN